MEYKTKFITFEGPEGSGKTTVIKKLNKWFEDNSIPYVATREPGGNRIAESIRKIILDKENTDMDVRTEALLYAASRRQHIVETVNPALEQNKVVLCDRYLDSSLVYQGVGRGIGIDEVYDVNLFAIENRMPDLTIIFDVKPEIGLARISESNRDTNRLDDEKLEFHKKVYDGYMLIADKYPERIKKVDASLTPDEVFEQVLTLIKGTISNG